MNGLDDVDGNLGGVNAGQKIVHPSLVQKDVDRQREVLDELQGMKLEDLLSQKRRIPQPERDVDKPEALDRPGRIRSPEKPEAIPVLLPDPDAEEHPPHVAGEGHLLPPEVVNDPEDVLILRGLIKCTLSRYEM